MGAITNLVQNAGNFFNSTEEEVQLSRLPFNTVSDDTDEEDESSNEWERFLTAKRNNSRKKYTTSIADISDSLELTKEKQANISYMIDDDGSIIKM